jgi:hypothetical protein
MSSRCVIRASSRPSSMAAPGNSNSDLAEALEREGASRLETD